MDKKQAGALGGRKTYQKYGRRHFQALGEKGAMVTWGRYSLKPIGQSQYAMVNNTTGEIICIKHG
jgi:hypothetical protein